MNKSLSIALVSLIVLSFTSKAQVAEKKKISLEDVWKKGTFSMKSVSGFNPMADGKHYSALYVSPTSQEKFILKYEYLSGKVVDTIAKESNFIFNGSKIKMDGYEFNSLENKLLITSDVEPVYRRSSLENCFVYDLQTKKMVFISPKGKQKYSTFSPDGSKIGYVRDNNLFYYDLTLQQEFQITTTGKQNEIINGGTDWVYEEEFEFARAFFWSKDSKKIAYYVFNEKDVKEFSMTMYDGLYPSEYRYKYPKAGERNSEVEVHIYSLENKNDLKLNIGEEKDQYIPRIKWTEDANTLCVYRMNRWQNKLELILYNASSGSSKPLYTETSNTYIEINDDLTFLKDGKHFIITNETNGFRHLYLYALSGDLKQAITTGRNEITQVYGIDEKNKKIYFQQVEKKGIQRGVYVIGLDGKNLKRLSSLQGTNDARFSNDYSLFINYYSNANSPLTVSLYNSSGKELRVLEKNDKLNNTLKEYELTKKEFLEIPGESGVALNSWMMKPVNFDSTKKYPVFMFVYGGPGSQQVLDSWGGANYFWYQHLTQKGYIVVCVDNRGTGGRGKEFKACTYMNLGDLETKDQIAAAQWLSKQSYVDGSRIGIQGWSYGGYMSSLCIAKGADVFKAAIAVAPVTNWRYYDSIYTERYLRTPQENAKGYDENSPINFADRIKGNFLLIHGTADDNVHFQNSVDFATSLINKNIAFQSAYYPNKNHGIFGGNTRLHLYQMMTDFIVNKL